MTGTTAATRRAWTKPASKAGRFDQSSIALHWLTVALVIGQLTTAFMLLQAEDGAGSAVLLTTHRSMGIITWMVGAFRLVWRLRFAKLPPFPASMPKWQQLVAKANEYGLYGLLLVQPITGLGDTVFRGRPFMFIVWKVPTLVHVDKPVFHAFHAAHEVGAISLLALIGLHAGAALLHGVVLRDGVLQRMLPWTPR
jgi:cytochrome b561